MPTDTTTHEKLLLSASETARVLSISERTLFSMTAPRGSIPAVRMGSRVLYSVAALQSWINGQTVVSVDEGGVS